VHKPLSSVAMAFVTEIMHRLFLTALWTARPSVFCSGCSSLSFFPLDHYKSLHCVIEQVLMYSCIIDLSVVILYFSEDLTSVAFQISFVAPGFICFRTAGLEQMLNNQLY
jgi:hypothetical protein